MLLKNLLRLKVTKLPKSTILEPIQSLRRGKRHAGPIVKIRKRTKFRTHEPNTGIVKEGLTLGLRRF